MDELCLKKDPEHVVAGLESERLQLKMCTAVAHPHNPLLRYSLQILNLR